MKRLSVIIGLVLLLASCTGDRKMQELLDRAEGYLPAEVDSASVLLDSVSPSSLSREGVALYGLLRTMTDAMTGKGVTTDSLIRPAYIYYKEQGRTDENTRRLGRSAFYLARFEESRDSTKQAEDLYREAIHCSEQVEDWRTCYLAYYYFAREKAWSDKEEAILLLNTAVEVYHKVEDKPANLVSMLLDLSINHIAFEHIDSAFSYANQAYDIACAENMEIQQFTAKRRLAVIYYESGNYPKALELVKQGMHGLTDQTRDAALFSLADCYLACDSLEQAKTTLQTISKSDNKMRYAVCRKLTQIAIHQHNTPSAIAYSDSAYQAVISVFGESQHQKELYYKSLIDEELANERLIHHNQTLRYSFIIIILVIVILVLVSYRKIQMYIRQLNEKHRLNLLSHETLISELHARIEQFNEQVSQNEQSVNRYKQLLEQKQDELQQLQLQEINTQELQAKQLKYEQEISALQQLYTEEKEKWHKKEAKNRQTICQMQQYLIHQSKLYKDIVEKKMRIHKTDDNYWHNLEDLLNNCSNQFATRLKEKHPQMTNEQYHLCLLNRMGLSRKQIAEFLCISSDAIKKKHHEYKRSIFNITDSSINFSDLIIYF